MKTTIDLADDLAMRVKKATAAEGTSLRSAVHEALRLWLQTRQTKPQRPRISREVGVVDGQGLGPDASGMQWDQIRALGYGERG
jgi:Arc/MetJ family transcription regulator